MTKTYVYMVFACFLLATEIKAETVPVLSFGKSLPFRVPALSELKSEEFSNLIKSLVDEETVTLVFVEPQLNIDDITRCKTPDGITCFKQLSSAAEISYLPRVNQAIDTLYDTLSPDATTVSTSDDIISHVDSGKRTIFVNLDMATTSTDFVAHDKMIADTFSTLSKKFNNILVIYTGLSSKQENVGRSKRATDKVKIKKGEIGEAPVSCPNFIIAAKLIVKKDGENAADSQKITKCDSTGVKNNMFEVTITPFNLKMIFGTRAGTWALIGATMDGQPQKIPAAIYANEGFAYRCGENLSFYNGKTRVSLFNTQMMPSFKDAQPKFNIDKVVYCEGFWSPGIVAGLFVVIILLLILFTGLSWIMDINTMDKFDDPKGKTITISATD